MTKYFCCISLILLVFLFACTKETPPSPSGVYLNHAPEATYVGIDACKTCHIDKYNTFIRSQMGRSFRVATLSNSQANFDNIAPVYDSEIDLYYLPFHRGEDLFIKEFRISEGDTVYQRIEQIDFIVGSGHHTNSHMWEINGNVYQIPITWYVQEQTWDLPPGFRGLNNNERFDRPISGSCMNCHNARPTFDQASENNFPKIPHGIDCEQCHGPGSIHIEQKQQGIFVDTSQVIDYSIVNPKKLSPERQLDVCQNCHMQGVPVFQNGKTAYDFRPGMKLADIQNVFWPLYTDSLHAFIMASHPARLKQSACFKGTYDASKGFEKMTCVTCHNPHLPIEEMGENYFNDRCLSCHTTSKQLVCNAPEAMRQASNNDCVSCHMPTSGTTDIPHVAITDHFIRKPTPLPAHPTTAFTPFSQRTFVRLASYINTNPSNTEKATGYLESFETVTGDPQFLTQAEAFLQKAQQEESEETLAPLFIKLWFWQKKHTELISLVERINPEALKDAWTYYRIGTTYENIGNTLQATQYLDKAVALAPKHLRFRIKQADAYLSDGKLDTAISLFTAIITDHPKTAEVLNNRGFAYLQQGALEKAEADFKATLAISPNEKQALANLASLYYNTQRPAEAKPLVQRLLKLEPQNADYQMLWNLVK